MSVNDISDSIKNAMGMSSELNNIIGNVYNKMTAINNISQKINQNISNTTINNFNIDLQNVYSVYEEINQQQITLNNNILSELCSDSCVPQLPCRAGPI